VFLLLLALLLVVGFQTLKPTALKTAQKHVSVFFILKKVKFVIPYWLLPMEDFFKHSLNYFQKTQPGSGNVTPPVTSVSTEAATPYQWRRLRYGVTVQIFQAYLSAVEK
jgi:hypothetical protein